MILKYINEIEKHIKSEGNYIYFVTLNLSKSSYFSIVDNVIECSFKAYRAICSNSLYKRQTKNRSKLPICYCFVDDPRYKHQINLTSSKALLDEQSKQPLHAHMILAPKKYISEKEIEKIYNIISKKSDVRGFDMKQIPINDTKKVIEYSAKTLLNSRNYLIKTDYWTIFPKIETKRYSKKDHSHAII